VDFREIKYEALELKPPTKKKRQIFVFSPVNTVKKLRQETSGSAQ
jgi:hypothetical protein